MTRVLGCGRRGAGRRRARRDRRSSANPKFFSAGADIKRFIEGDVGANMEMIRVSQAAFRRMAARRAGVHRPPRRARARAAASRSRWRATSGSPTRAATSSGTPEVTLGPAPGQRRHAAADPAGRAVARDSSCCVTGRTFSVEEGREIGPDRRASTTPTRPQDEVRSTPRGSPRCRRWRSPRSSAACTRAARRRSTTGWRSRPS